MKRLLPWRRLLSSGLLALALLGSTAWAQLNDQAPINMPEAERARWQAVLDAPVDPNGLHATRNIQYRQKNLAAFKLGDNTQRENILREWAQFNPEEGKWNLFSYLALTEKRSEAYQLGNELVQSVKYPPSAARIRIQLAGYNIDDSNLKEAARLLEAAENMVRFDLRNMQRRGADSFWIARAEVDFNITKSRLSMRQGKWNDGIQFAKIAVEKTKALTQTISIAPSENEKQWAYGSVVWATQELATHQTLAGLYADAEWSLRDSHKMAKEFGFNENHLVGFYNRVADLYLANGQFKEAASFAARSEKILIDQGFQQGSPLWLFARNRTNAALIGDDRWREALESFDLVDQETKRLNRPPRGVSTQAILRSYVYIKTGRHDAALRLLRGNMRWNTDNFGEDHYFTAVNRGLLATALWKTGDDAQARIEFARALKNMSSQIGRAHV